MIYIRRLVWDKWKIAHIARHGVRPSEVEEVCYGKPLEREGYKRRIIRIGPTKAGRVLAVILEPSEKTHAYYPCGGYLAYPF